MPHSRHRYLGDKIRKALSYYPMIGIMGQRQVGKTTLASHFSKEYVTLDIRQQLEICEKDPESFLSNRHHPFVVDECQMSPALFPVIKDVLRRTPKPGQFILTGSVRFASRKNIRESLTGRIAIYELLPMNITEAFEEPLNTLPADMLEKNKGGVDQFKRLAKQRSEKKWRTRMASFLETGGLPGVCFVRNKEIRHKKWESYLETVLLRDLQLILQTTLSYPTLRNLAAQIALQQGMPLEISDLAKQTGISAITLKKLLSALQGLYLIREVRGMGGMKKSTYYFEDQGLAHHLMAGWKNPFTDMMRLLFGNVRQQFLYGLGSDVQLFHYKTRGGASVPLVLQAQAGTIGYTACLEKLPTTSALFSAKSFIRAHPKAFVIISHQGDEIRMWDDKILSVPMHLVV